MADAESAGELVIPGRLTRRDGALQGQAVAPAEGLKDVPDDEAVRGLLCRLLRHAHGGNPSFRMVSRASGIFIDMPSSVERQPGKCSS